MLGSPTKSTTTMTMQTTKPLKIMAVLGEGGHTTELLKLIELMGNDYTYHYLMSRHDEVSELKIKWAGQTYRAIKPYRKWHHRSPKIIPFLRIWVTIIQQLYIMLKVRPDAVLSTGASIAIPAAIWGRMLGAKVIHIETAARVYDLSKTGRIMYHIADLFFVQWDSLLAKYPKATFAGRIL